MSEKVAIGIHYKDGSVRSILCRQEDNTEDTLLTSYLSEDDVDALMNRGNIVSLKQFPRNCRRHRSGSSDFNRACAHDCASDFFDERRNQGHKCLYLYDETSDDKLPIWYYHYLDSHEDEFTCWKDLHEKHVNEYINNYVKNLSNYTENKTMTKYTEIQPNVWHIVPTDDKQFIHLVITADTSGTEIASVIDISNFEDVEGTDVPVEAIPALIERLQKIYDQYNWHQ